MDFVIDDGLMPWVLRLFLRTTALCHFRRHGDTSAWLSQTRSWIAQKSLGDVTNEEHSAVL
jgi:hypothetical protein